jgi:hypothetical protein
LPLLYSTLLWESKVEKSYQALCIYVYAYIEEMRREVGAYNIISEASREPAIRDSLLITPYSLRGAWGFMEL